MQKTVPNLKGHYLLAAYVCIIALAFIARESAVWLSQGARCLALPILILFYYINTAIDSKFEKNIFYGIVLFAISTPVLMAYPILGQASVYIAIALWIIGYFSYSRALISITSVPGSLLYKHKWLTCIVFLLGLVAQYFYLTKMLANGISMVPMICLGLACLVFFMATINLWGQVAPILVRIFIIGSVMLILYNELLGLNINGNISIFDIKTSLFFYLGQLLMIIGAVRCSIGFRNNDFSSISSILNKNKKN